MGMEQIEYLIEQARVDAQELRERQERAQAEREAQEAEARADAREALMAAIEMQLPEAVQGFLSISEGVEARDRRATVHVVIPGLAKIWTFFQRSSLNEPWKWTPSVWYMPGDPYIQQPYEAGEEPAIRYGREWHYSSEELGQALIKAQDIQQKTEQLVVQVEAMITRDRERREQHAREYAEWKQRQREREAEAIEAQEAEQDLLWTWVGRDPVSLGLVRVFAAIQEERAAYEARLEDAEDAMGQMEERYAERLNRRDQAVERSQRRVDEAEQRALDAEDELAQVKRQR